MIILIVFIIFYFRESIVEKDIVGECETEYSPVGVNWGKQTFRFEHNIFINIILKF